MALDKQPIAFNFSQGIDTKSDSKQVAVGRFLNLVNSIFLKGGLLQSRNGFQELSTVEDATSITTFNDGLTAIGTTLQAYSSSLKTWTERGVLLPCTLATLPLIRNNTNQSQADSVVASNGLVCVAYTDQNPLNLTQNIYKYSVMDSTTGQVVVAPTQISNADEELGTPRTYLLGNYFIIIYTGKIVSTYHLYYIAISITNPTIVTPPISITSTFKPSTQQGGSNIISGLAFDAVLAENTLYIAWNVGTSSGLKIVGLNSGLQLGSTIPILSGAEADLLSLCFDQRGTGGPVLWLYWCDNTDGTLHVAVYDLSLNQILGDTLLSSTGVSVQNLSISAQNGVATFVLDIPSFSGIGAPNGQSDIILIGTISQVGFIVAPTVSIRSLGLASKTFVIGGQVYALGVFVSNYQTTYFLFNVIGQIIAKLAYENGGGYLDAGLPNITVNGNVVSMVYLNKDLIQAVNKNTNVPPGSQVNGIYAQTGINLATFNLTTVGQLSAEIGDNLNLTGGFTWAYDGYTPTEQEFFLYPDTVAVGNGINLTPTGNTTSGSPIITSLSSIVSIVVGMNITGTDVPANSVVLSINSSTSITINNNATGSASGTMFTFTGNIDSSEGPFFYLATYEWSDNQGNLFRSAPSVPVTSTVNGTGKFAVIEVPTLRLTYKVANPVKIVIYRWSREQPIYYQATSILTPVLNDLTIDTVEFVDISSDLEILGNNILYTTGGVLENIGPPSFVSTFLFDDRLFGITSEDRNLLWFSKQVIESTPVEMSDVLTLYVAPNIGAQGSTGPLTCGFAMDDKAILFKRSAINYFNGTGPDNTGSNSQYSQPIFVTSTIGCSNQKSIVLTPQGLMFEFASPSGNQIWLLGRDLATQYIGAAVEGFTLENTVLSAINLPGTNQVRITMSNNITLMYDYYYNQWGTFSNIPARSSILYGGLHTYLDIYGRVFQETPNQYLDGARPVTKSFTTGWINFNQLQGYQRAYFFYLLGTYYSPHTLQIAIAYDYEEVPTQFATFTPDNYQPAFGGGGGDFGTNAPYGGSGTLENCRVFFKQERCQAFQLTITEVYDPSYGSVYGKGVSISGINCIVGFKRGYRPIKVATSIGAS